MADLGDLYQDMILGHSKSPRNFHVLDDANRNAQGDNPLCGDRVTVYARVEDDRVAEVSFQGAGCAICMASASMMTESVKGKDQTTVLSMFETFHDLVMGKPANDGPPLGKLEAFAGVSQYPVRVKCASLPWHTLKAALDDAGEPVTTE